MVIALLLAAGFLAPATSHAATYTWWATGSSGSVGGTGTWDTSALRWTADGSTWSPWNNAGIDTAIFGGASAGTVTLSTGITVGGLTFDTTGYTIAGSTLTLAGGTAAITTNANATTISSLIAGTAALRKLGSGTLTLSGSNTYSGNTVVDAGTVVSGTSAAYTGGNSPAFGSGNITVNNALITGTTVFAVTGGQNTTRSLTLNSGTWNIDYAATGGEYVRTLVLTSGLVTTSNTSWFRAPNGGLSISSLASSGTSVITPRLDLTLSSLTVDVADGAAANDLELNGSITENTGAGSGAKSITKSGAGTVLFAASNSYSGGTTVSAGRIVLGNNASLGTGTVTLDGGTIERNAIGTVANAIAVGAGGGTIIGRQIVDDYTVLSGRVTGSGPLTAQGLVFLNNTSNTYSGTLTISNASASYLALGASEVLGDTAVVSLGGTNARFALNGGVTETIGGLAGSAGNVLTRTSGTARLKVASSGTYGGTFSNAGNSLVLEKSGSGVLVLNSVTGNGAAIAGVEVSGGTLRLAGSGVAFSTNYFTGSQPITVRSGATLEVTGSWNTAATNVITVDGGTLSVTAGTVADGVNYINNLTLMNGATISGNALRSGYFSDVTISSTGSVTNTISAGLILASGSGGISRTTTFAVGTGTLAMTGTVADLSGFVGMPVIKSGAGTLVMTASNTFSGATTISGGTLQLGSGGTTGGLSSSSTISVGSGATLAFSRTDNYGRNYANAISGSGGLAVLSGSLTLSNANTYTGPTTVAGGVLLGGIANAFGSSAPLAVNSGTVNLGGFSQSVGALSGSAGTLITTSTAAGSATLTSSFTSGTSTFAGSIADNVSGTVAFTKSGAGTQIFAGTNTFSGATSIADGVLSIGGTSALQGTSGLTIAGGAGLTYTGGAATFGKNITVTAGSGTGTITNSGGSLLTLSGTLSKDNSVLRLTGGSFNVTGLITGTTVGKSDLFVDAASVTLSNTNTYNGPTYVYNSGTLSLGINNAIPNTSVVTLGDAASVGTLMLGTFTDSISQLVFSSSGGTLSLSGDKTAAVQLATAGSLTLGSNANLMLTSPGTSVGLYRLISATSISGSFAPGNVTGLPSAYSLLYSGTEIDLQRKGDQSTTFTMSTGTVTRALVNSTVALSGTITNASPAGSANLAVSLSSGGVLTITGLSSGTSSVAPQTPTSVAGTINAGSTVGSQTWSAINTDNNAIQTTSAASGLITVVNQRTFTTSTSTIAFGNVHQGKALSSSLTVTSNGANATTANASLGSFTGGPSGLSLTTNDSTAFNGGSGSQQANYSLTGTAGTLGSLAGTFSSQVAAELGSINDVTVAVTGNVYSGQAVWNTNGNGSWGSLSSGFGSNWGANQGSPGLDTGFTNTDTATFAGAVTGGTATIDLNGVTPSLKSITFNTGSASYLLSGGVIALSSDSGTAGLNVGAGSHEIASNLSLFSLTAVDIATNSSLTLSGSIGGSGGFVKTGGGELDLKAANSFTGNTAINAGILKIFHASTFGSGTVTLASGATLNLNNLSIGNTLINNGGTILNSGSYMGAQTVSGSAHYTGSTAGTIDVTSGGSATFSGPVAANVTLDAGASASVSGAVASTGAFTVNANSILTAAQGSSFAAGSTISNAGQFNVNVSSGTTPIASTISGTGALAINGGGLVQLTGANAGFTGQMTVSGSGTRLAVNSALGSTSVTIDAGAILGGSGSVAGVLTGAGLVSPGNSPGILTATQFDPTNGLGAAFEFTASAPVYNAPSASLNDALRLTNSSTPFVSSLTAANHIDVYFNVSSIANGDIFEGGFFTGLSATALLTAVKNATFTYWVKDSSGTTSFNGYSYSLLTSLQGITGAKVTTVDRIANFGSGDVTGSVTQFVIIPEPDTIIFAGIGIAMAGWSLWKRRRIAQMLRRYTP